MAHGLAAEARSNTSVLEADDGGAVKEKASEDSGRGEGCLGCMNTFGGAL